MIDFKPIIIESKSLYEQYLPDGSERGCEYTFSNLFMWGHQHITILHDQLIIFSYYNGHYYYSYPIGTGDKKAALDAIITDAKCRDIPLCIIGLYGNAKQTLTTLYPNTFHIQSDRDSYDYVYDINDLADLQGRKYHRKRTHCNRFRDAFPSYTVEPLHDNNISQVRQMLDAWYKARLLERPDNDYKMEQLALDKALNHYKELNMEGIILVNNGEILAMTIGSLVSDDTFDVHFEKARWDVDGAYTVINSEFAKHIRNKFPHIKYINREEDMGLEGLRKSKESYYPHHMIEKCSAQRL